jgi:hypothetical protein
LELLDERERSVEQDHQDDGDADRPAADNERQQRRHPQQQRERMGQLTRQLTRPFPTTATTQRVWAILDQAALRLTR